MRCQHVRAYQNRPLWTNHRLQECNEARCHWITLIQKLLVILIPYRYGIVVNGIMYVLGTSCRSYCRYLHVIKKIVCFISKNMKLDTSTFKKHGIRLINFRKIPILKWRYILYTNLRPNLGIHLQARITTSTLVFLVRGWRGQVRDTTRQPENGDSISAKSYLSTAEITSRS